MIKKDYYDYSKYSLHVSEWEKWTDMSLKIIVLQVARLDDRLKPCNKHYLQTATDYNRIGMHYCN